MGNKARQAVGCFLEEYVAVETAVDHLPLRTWGVVCTDATSSWGLRGVSHMTWEVRILSVAF